LQRDRRRGRVAPAASRSSGSRASVEYTLAADGDARLAVFDLLDARSARCSTGARPPECNQVDWNTAALPSGIYFYRLRAGDASLSKIVRIVSVNRGSLGPGAG